MRVIEDKSPIWPFILLSLLVHLLLTLGITYIVGMPKPHEEQVVEIYPIPDAPNAVGKLPIADIDKPDVEKRPDKPKFLGSYDSSVDKEQVATGKVAEKGGNKEGERESGEAKKASKPKEEKSKSEKADKGLVAPYDKKSAKKKSLLGDGGLGSPSGDFFPDFKIGAKTYLNVLRYPDVDYFVRMKRVFRTTFNPEPSLRHYFSLNRISRGAVEVVLGVGVDKTGALSEVFVFRSSGIPGYDEEALRTVRASAPFSTPPEKFLENDGQLRMSWTFTVYL